VKSIGLGLAAWLLLGLAHTGFAQELNAEPRFADTVVAFETKGAYSNLTLTVTGPDGFHARAVSRGGMPRLDLREFGTLEDGSYTWQLTGSTEETGTKRMQLDDGRATQGRAPLKSVTTSGTFMVREGAIMKRGPATGKRDRS
jgi:hypothetical protein